MARRTRDLTEREREVLDLVRQGLTNDQIAEHLGITSDGVKYHISQVLAKLGVSSRQDAVDIVYGEARRPWWKAALVPALLRLAGAGVVLGAVAFVTLLLWGVLQSDDSAADLPDVTGLSPEDVYASVERAATRPGQVLHSEIEATVTADGETTPYFTMELWVDAAQETVRSEYHLDPSQDSYDRATEGLAIVSGPYIYFPDDPGEALRQEVEETTCPGVNLAWMSALLLCGADWTSTAPIPFGEPRLESGEFKGQATVILVFESSETVPVQGESGPPASPVPLDTSDPGAFPRTQPPAPTLAPGRETQTLTTTWRAFISSPEFLPLAYTITQAHDDEELGIVEAVYDNEFLPLNEEIETLLDPRSIGYGAENSDALLDEIQSSVHVYWLGEEFSGGEGLGELVLTRILVGEQPGEGGQSYGVAGELIYEAPDGWPIARIRLWHPPDWEEFQGTGEGFILSDRACANRIAIDAEGGPASVYILPYVQFPDPPGTPVIIAPPDAREPPPTPPPGPPPTAEPNESPCNFQRRMVALLDTVIGVIERDNVVIEVRQDDYAESVDAMRSLMEQLVRR